MKLPDQEKFYADRRGSGTCFYRHAELEQAGIPVLAVEADVVDALPAGECQGEHPGQHLSGGQ